MNIKALLRDSTVGIRAHTEHHSILASTTSVAVGAGMSELAGFLIGKYHEKLQKTEVPVPLVVGGALQIGSILLRSMGGHGFGASVGIAAMRALGDAGTNTFFALDGVARGYASAGAPLQMSDGGKSRSLPRGWGAERLWGQPASGNVNVGAIPQASPGDWLSGPGLRHFAEQGR